MNTIKHLQRPIFWVAFILGSVPLLGAEHIFEDTAKSLSLSIGGGQVAWGDFNNDGWEDLVVANGFISTEDTGDL